MNRRTFNKTLALTIGTIGLTGVPSFARKRAQQLPSARTPDGWQPYTIINEKVSFDLPIAPQFDFRRTSLGRDRGSRLEVSLGSYADGAAYAVYVFENSSFRQSIDSFIQRQLASRKNWDLNTGRKVTFDGVEGKAFTAIDPNYGHAQFFSTGDRLYQFIVFGVPPDDPRASRFFSSLSLTRKKDSTEISERFQHPGYPVTAAPPDPPETFTAQQVDRRVIVAFRVEPRYTESARQDSVRGVVILKCLFSADGRINGISVVQGLPHGLTERAIAAARKMIFVPAMKDGRFVQTLITVEFYFNLY